MYFFLTVENFFSSESWGRTSRIKRLGLFNNSSSKPGQRDLFNPPSKCDIKWYSQKASRDKNKACLLVPHDLKKFML